MAKVSLNQASKDTGVSLPTLSRWRKAGRISADRNGSGGYLIDTSEYDRIQELKKQPSNMKYSKQGDVKGPTTQHETPNEIKVLVVEVEVLKERIKDKDKVIEDLREDRDDWKKQAQTILLQTATVTHKSLQTENDSTNFAIKKSGLFITSKSLLIGFAVLLLLTFGTLGWMATLVNQNQLTNKSQSIATHKSETGENDENGKWHEWNNYPNLQKTYTPIP